METCIKCIEKNKVAIEEMPIRKLQDDDVIVSMKYTLISNGTEKSRLMGTYNSETKFPYIPGYSGVGIVKDTGKKVLSVKPGDRVFVSHGGHASVNIKRESSLVKIPEKVSDIDAVYAKIASFPMHALRRTHFEFGESVVIVGLGMLGLFGVQLAKIGGALPIVAIGNRDERRELAYKFGADYVFEPQKEKLVEEVINVASITGKGADVIIETSGTTEGLNLALQYVAKNGRISLVGCNRVTEHPIDLWKLHLKGVQLVGANASTQKNYESAMGQWTARKNFNAVFGYMNKNVLTPSLIPSKIYSPLEAPRIYRDLVEDSNFPLGVVFDWDLR